MPLLNYKTQEFTTKVMNHGYRRILKDRRCQFYDLSKLKPDQRVPRSPIIQFYSSADNIGNYMPVLGIWKMLDHQADTWCIQDSNIDFDFINRHYKCVIIGGAGLLVLGGGKFERFWQSVLEKCRLPIFIWGVGTDRVQALNDSYKNTVRQVAQRCEMINVRDQLTADAFQIKDCDISACPTIVYLDSFREHHRPSLQTSIKANFIYYQPQIHNDDNIKQMGNVIRRKSSSAVFHSNYQYSYRGLEDVIQNFYLKNNLVITTMLHGAITAYGLGIPYVAIGKTDKICAFHARFGNGLIIETAQELEAILDPSIFFKIQLKPADIQPVYEFGKRARQRIEEICFS